MFNKEGSEQVTKTNSKKTGQSKKERRTRKKKGESDLSAPQQSSASSGIMVVPSSGPLFMYVWSGVQIYTHTDKLKQTCTNASRNNEHWMTATYSEQQEGSFGRSTKAGRRSTMLINQRETQVICTGRCRGSACGSGGRSLWSLKTMLSPHLSSRRYVSLTHECTRGQLERTSIHPCCSFSYKWLVPLWLVMIMAHLTWKGHVSSRTRSAYTSFPRCIRLFEVRRWSSWNLMPATVIWNNT